MKNNQYWEVNTTSTPAQSMNVWYFPLESHLNYKKSCVHRWFVNILYTIHANSMCVPPYVIIHCEYIRKHFSNFSFKNRHSRIHRFYIEVKPKNVYRTRSRRKLRSVILITNSSPNSTQTNEHTKERHVKAEKLWSIHKFTHNIRIRF